MVEDKIPELPELPEQKKGIKQEIGEIKETLDRIAPKIKEGKKWKLSWGAKNKVKNKKPHTIGLLKLQTNRTAWFDKSEINNGFINVDGKKYNASTDFVYLLEGKFPLIVMKEWDMDAVGTKDYYDAIAKGRKVDSQTVFIRALEQIQAEEGGKKKISMNMWIWIGIGAVILGYVIFSGQGKGK